MFLSCFTLLRCFLVSFDCPLMALPGSFHGSLSTLLVALHSSLMLQLLFLCMALHGALCSMFLPCFTLLQCFLVLCHPFTVLLDCLLMALVHVLSCLHLFLTQRS